MSQKLPTHILGNTLELMLTLSLNIAKPCEYAHMSNHPVVLFY